MCVCGGGGLYCNTNMPWLWFEYKSRSISWRPQSCVFLEQNVRRGKASTGPRGRIRAGIKWMYRCESAGGAARLRYLASHSEVPRVPSIFPCHQQFYLRRGHQYCFHSARLPTFTTSVSWLSRLNKTQMAHSIAPRRATTINPDVRQMSFLETARPPRSGAARFNGQMRRLGRA